MRKICMAEGVAPPAYKTGGTGTGPAAADLLLFLCHLSCKQEKQQPA